MSSHPDCMRHSPLPWRVMPETNQWVFVQDSEQNDVGSALLLADAAFIVTACNSRDELLDALKVTRGNIRSLGPAGALDCLPLPYQIWLKVVDDAIAKAEA